MSDVLKVSRDDEVAVVTLNRPDSFNSLNLELGKQLADNMITIAADPEVRAAVVTGEGKAFCAGGDLKYMLAFEAGPAAALHELAARFHQCVLEIRRMRKPVIAAVNGVAAGAGFSLALACDFRVMAKKAVFRQAYTSSGLSIDGGGTYTLPRMLGLARAMEIAAFDKPIDSAQALAWGLITKIAEEDALKEALSMAHELAATSLHSFGLSKQLMTDSFETSFETQLDRERNGISSCALHPDGKEGIKAFTEKRKPVFFGK